MIEDETPKERVWRLLSEAKINPVIKDLRTYGDPRWRRATGRLEQIRQVFKPTTIDDWLGGQNNE